MNWEVWTMPRKTSFCNGTLLCSDLRHCWPAGFLYVLVWLMILPLQLLRGGYDCSRALPHEEMLVRLEAELHNVITGAAVGSLVMAVLCGIVIPMAVYAYLMSPRAVGMMHALPVKRSTQYFSHFTAGFGLLTGGNVLILLLSVLAQLPFGMVDWAALGQWLLLTELLELFFLSLGIRQDLFGVQYRVPNAGQVDTVAVRVSYTDAGYCLTDDPEIIALTTELHRAILAQGPATDENDGYLDITINYVLKSGQEIRRVYMIDKNSGTETYRLANQLLNTTQFRRYAVGLDQLKPEEESAVRGGYVEDSETGATVELTREQAQELLLAAQQDVASAADTDVLADIGSSTKEASTDVVTVPTETSPSPWRYQIILYVTAADGGTRDRYLQMQRYCTRMQTFISGLDFANSTADVPATEAAS